MGEYIKFWISREIAQLALALLIIGGLFASVVIFVLAGYVRAKFRKHPAHD